MKHFMVIMIAFLFVFFEGCKKVNDNPFPEHLNTKVELHSSEDSVEQRVTQYSPAGEKLVYVRTDFRNGVVVVDYFREDGTLREENEFFPSSGEETHDLSKRQMRRLSLFDTDGKTLLSRRFFRLDGTVESHQRFRVDGWQETEHYSKDAKHITLRELRNRDGKLNVREEFSETGILQIQVRVTPDDDIHIVEYRDDGVTRKALTIREDSDYRYSWNYPEYHVYHPDGITIAMKATYSSSSTTVKYYDQNGALEQKREYSDYGRFKLTWYWPNGEKRYYQYWTGPGYRNPHTDISKHKISEAEEFDFNGKKVREVEFYDNGNPEEEMILDGVTAYSGIRRNYSEEGILEKEVEIKRYYDYGETKTFEDAEEPIKADLPAGLTSLDDRPLPPDSSDLPDFEIDE